jgi:FKBP-type peptidyl-prolyl cis-trans isomerase
MGQLEKVIRFKEVKVGDGPVAEHGQSVKIRYVGCLNRGDVLYPESELTFVVGERDTTPMLKSSVLGMRVGGLRETIVSPHLAFRDRTDVPGVPPNAVIRWRIGLLSVGGRDEES